MGPLWCLAVLSLAIFTTTESASSKKGYGQCGPVYKCGESYALSDATWWYNWHEDFQKDVDKKWYKCPRRERGEYIPMIAREHNVKGGHAHIRQDTKRLLVFNEPNVYINGGYRLPPERAAKLWPQILKIANGREIIGPGLTSCDNYLHSCITWYDRFFKACPTCRMEKMAIHSYHCDANMLMKAIETMHKKFYKPIWITEFACTKGGGVDADIKFMKEIIPRLEKSPYVEKYAWFCTRLQPSDHNKRWNLLNQDSATLTKAGKAYNSIR